MHPISLHSLPPAFEIFQGVAGFCKRQESGLIKARSAATPGRSQLGTAGCLKRANTWRAS